jgi:hypothetical protein
MIKSLALIALALTMGIASPTVDQAVIHYGADGTIRPTFEDVQKMYEGKNISVLSLEEWNNPLVKRSSK